MNSNKLARMKLKKWRVEASQPSSQPASRREADCHLLIIVVVIIFVITSVIIVIMVIIVIIIIIRRPHLRVGRGCKLLEAIWRARLSTNLASPSLFCSSFSSCGCSTAPPIRLAYSISLPRLVDVEMKSAHLVAFVWAGRVEVEKMIAAALSARNERPVLIKSLIGRRVGAASQRDIRRLQLGAPLVNSLVPASQSIRFESSRVESNRSKWSQVKPSKPSKAK